VIQAFRQQHEKQAVRNCRDLENVGTGEEPV